MADWFYTREGILELSARGDDDIAQTLLRSEVVGGVIREGVKYYLAGANATLKGKTIRRNGTALPNGINATTLQNNFSTYWEVVFNAPSGESSQAIRDLEQKTQDLSVFAPVATGWTDATQTSQGGFYNSATAQSLTQAKALGNNQFVRSKTSAIQDHILARIPANTDPAQYRILFTSGRGVHAYHPTLSTYQNLGADSNWQYFRYQSILGDDVASLVLQVTASSAHIGHTEFRGTLGDGIVTTDSIKDGAITAAKLDSGISLGGGGGLSTVATDDTIEGDGSSADPLKVSWRDEVVKNTNDSARMKLVTGDILAGERREPSWGQVNNSGAEGGLASNNGDGYWNETRAKAATYSARAITASSNGDYFVARIPVSADPRQYVVREANTFSGTIDNPVNGMRRLGSNANWHYYIEDVRLFGTVSLRSSNHLVGQNVWGGGLGDGIVSPESLDSDVQGRLLPEPTNDSADSAKVAALKSDGSGYELVPQSGTGGSGGLSFVATDDTLDGTGTSSDALTIPWRGDVTKNTSAVDRLKLATADIIVGETRVPSWGAVNASGAQGGIAYAENWTLESAKTASYSAPTLTLPNGGGFVVIRIPAGGEPRNWFIREPGGIFGNIDAHLNEITFLGTDDTWDYYWERVRWFGTIRLERSTHNTGFNTWGGKLGDAALRQLGGAGTPAQAYFSLMQDGSSTALTGTWLDLTLAGSPVTNQGTFTASGSEVTIGVAGAYIVRGQVRGAVNGGGGASSNRVRIESRLFLTQADSTTTQSPMGSAYIRNQYSSVQSNIATCNAVWSLGVGDTVKLQGRAQRQNSGEVVTLDNGQCSLSLALVGSSTAGPKGDPGEDGAGLTNGSVTLARLADAVAKRLLPAILGSAGQVLQVNSDGTGVEYADGGGGGGGLAFKQVARDTDHDNDVNGRLTDTSIDVPTDSGLYGISFSSGGKIHAFNLAGLNSKTSSNRSFATANNSYTFDSDSSSSATVYYLGRNTTTGKITVGHRGGNANEVVTLYLIAAS